MREFASHVISLESGFLTLVIASDGCGVFDRLDTFESSTWMNLKRRCPPPVQSSPSLAHLEQDGCAVSHYNTISIPTCCIVSILDEPSSSVSDKRHIHALKVLQAFCCATQLLRR
jgi:hypothetical protein